MPRSARPSSARRALVGLLKALGVLLVISLGAYALFSGAFGEDRRAVEALEDHHLLVGASLGAWPTDNDPVIERFETQTGIRLDIVDVFLDWRTPYANVSHTVDHIMDRGSIPMLSWEAHGFTTRDILDGTKTAWLRDGRAVPVDAYLDEFAEGACATAKAFRVPLLLRTLHEFNGSWFTWGISYVDKEGNRPNTDESYRQAWIHIHSVFRGHCGSEVLFVWSVNHFSVGEGATFTGPFPGDAYVDFVGLDGYNWGDHAPWGWQTFDEIFTPSYCAVTNLSRRPILLAEIASTEAGGNKAEWVRDLLRTLEDGEFPGVQGVVWFNDAKFEIEIGGQMDWPIESSRSSLAAFSVGAKQLLAQRDDGPASEDEGRRSRC